MTGHLIGGGRDERWYGEVYGPFPAEAGSDPAVACVLLDEGDVPEQFARRTAAFASAAPRRPYAVPVVAGVPFDPAALDGADAVFVGVGGRLADGIPVRPEDAAEDLDEIEVGDGPGLAAPAVEVHAAQWGTLGRPAGRPAAAVARGAVASGVAIDEDTALTVGADGRALVRGAGLVHVVRPDGDGVRVRSFRPGERVAL